MGEETILDFQRVLTCSAVSRSQREAAEGKGEYDILAAAYNNVF